ncbi:5-azacytidine-induced protein 2 [Pantherophis guttatus]|uniref:5-azacytidine-induced protein 2 n=1 Tax=Pantherophis guttatus TaxID=94885 RepID=A0A6P9ANG6_PANGU|nr:5-azacytidine-induced protein 2 [Pantherophis guttatus]XP_060541787.1 5-azacytidine-induced protein 2 [Pantherophis guttatus]
MEEVAEDDIDILNREKADTHHRQDGQFPIPVFSGEESVASHFALVTAYEDIKKRLKETERENSFLKKRVRLLEEKLLESHLEEATSSVGREQVNKAYQAYRESCIERDNLKSQLDKTMKENMEYVKILNEQLQSKEVELLQLRTEVETQQVMKSFNSNPSNWEIDKLNNELKMHNLELDLEKLKEEYNHFRKEMQKSVESQGSLINGEFIQQQNIHSERIQQVYRELKREMSNLHLVTKVQVEMLKKLKLIPSTTKKVPSYTSVQCIEDLERDATNLHLGASGAICKNRLLQTSGDVFGTLASSSPCTNEKFSSACDSPFLEHNSYGKNSLEDNSWVFPSPPKPSETVFWEMKNRVTHLNFPGNNLDQYNQNCLHKS